jgi:4'-phosphopantetheinyl transferase
MVPPLGMLARPLWTKCKITGGRVDVWLGVVGEQTCEVWWATPAGLRPEHVALLDGVERERQARYLRMEDRDRFTLGVAVTRLALGRILGLEPAKVPLTRACRDCGKPHGPPVVAGGPHLSVSHSGQRVAVAVSEVGPVGVDVEAATRRLDESITGHVLSADETMTADPGELLSYWTRKEAIVKATGDGLRAPMTDITVSSPAEPPRLLAWSGRSDLVGRIDLHTLDPGLGYAACLALIDQPGISVHERPAVEIL